MPFVTFIACLLAVIAGCKSEDRPKPPPLPIDGIEIVKPGAEPRQTLRYALAPGADTQIDLAMDVDLKTTELDLKLPTIVLGLDLATTAMDADGRARMKLAVAHARAVSRGPEDAGALGVMDRQTRQLVGLVVTFALSPAGVVEDTKLVASGRDLSGPMQEQVTTLLQATEQLAMALPDKPIGVGGVWKHRRTIKQNQLTLVSTTLVEVTAIAADKITFKSSTEMTGADQTLAQGSATAQVTGVRGTGTQSGAFELARAVVLGTTEATLGFEMIADGTRRPTRMTVTTRTGPREPIPETPSDAGVP